MSRSHDEAVAGALEFTCGVDQRYRRIALSRLATAYPSARGTLDEHGLTIRLRGPFGRLPGAMAAIELSGVEEASVKLSRFFGYVRIVPESAGVITLMTRRSVATDIAKWLRDAGIEVPERKTLRRM